MKKISFILALLILGTNADAATRGDSTRTVNSTATSEQPVQSARTARRAPSNRTPTAAQPKSNTPIATTPTRTVASRNTAQPNISAGRSAAPVVSARTAKQNVISTGTKVTSAAQNTVVDEECWNGFMGCMDSFCMLDNANGGRCICSDKNAEYDTILEEIQKLDEQSYQLATVGVEQIEMGNAADAVMARTKDVTKSVEKDTKNAQSKRKSLDLSQWNSTGDIDFDADVEDIFSLSSDGISIDNKTGDALFRASAKLCHAQMPNCANQSTMMELMYKQRVRSDCTAYENSLRQQRTQSAQKLYAAQSAMREAALEQYQNANKYDLGQCTVQFKQCMQTTGGCGEDFTGCVDLAARAEASRSASETGKAAKQKTISGLSSKITIAASTYDTLLAKQPLCMTVTEQCVNVRDQVWDTFIREVAPQVKAAELVVESNMRSSCISNISNCFQKACRDTMDPNDPEGSYDMCLTRPQTLESLCRVEIEPCKAAEPKIMDYVVARLASMRVDSCTREFKECLQSEDRCGSDYSQCVGLDTDTIVRMCPAEKLVGCQYDYEGDNPMYSYDNNGTAAPKKKVRSDKEIYEELSKIAQGIFLNIDNNMLAACQKTIQAKVIEVCGSLTFCDAFEDDEIIGTDSLFKQKKNNGDTIIEGLMNFGLIGIDTTNNTLDTDNYQLIYKQQTRQGRSTQTNYISTTMANRKEQNNLTPIELHILSSMNAVKNKAEQKLSVITADLNIDRCINGRDDKWRGKTTTENETQRQRFPNILDTYKKMILNSALDKAYENYRKKYDEYVAEALEDQSDDVKQLMCASLTYDPSSMYCSKSRVNEETGEAICEEYHTNGALSNRIADMYPDTGTYGLSKDGLSIVIRGADLGAKLTAISDSGVTFVQTDESGNMVGTIQMTSFYSPSTNTCTITTTATMCKEAEAVYDITTEYCDGGGGVVNISGSCAGGGIQVLGAAPSTTTTTKTYTGSTCTEYGTPKTDVNEIRM